jgi:ABC-type multidrug transport system ATPase subunit
MAAAGRRTAGGAAGAGGAEQPEEFSAAAYFEGDNNAVVAKRSPWTVSILNLEVPRDLSREERETGDLAGPPTVATVLLGSSRLAYALGIDKRPSTTSSSGSTSSRGRNVLSGITFTLRPCESTLLLGPSSSGRSTLMTEVMMRCQGRKSPRELGEVAVNGQWPLRQRDRRSVAHAGQGDTALTPVFTVRETFQFAAALTEDPAVVDHSEDVDGVLRILGLNHVQNTLVGDENVRGVSGGQKRRVTVGEKVMGDRIRLLCLDEITNGLDSASALALGTALRQASELSHQCVLCSLLQPSRELFEQFHNVLLLTPGGEVAYFGPRGEAVAHFESLGFVKEAVAEDADFLLRAVAAPAAGDLDLAQLWRSSPEGRRVLQEAEAGIATAKESQPSSPPVPAFARPMKEQVQILVRRGVMLTLRDPVTLQRPVAAAFFGLILGTLFLDTPQDDQGLIVTVGYLFTVLFLIFFISVTTPISAHFADREAFFSQRDQSFYCTRSYYIASIMHNAPVSLAEATLIVALSYFLQGANLGAHGGAFFFALLLLCCVGMTGVAVSRVLAHASPLESFASALGQALLLFLSFMACYAPPYLGIPSWMRWISWISPPAYAYEALVINEVNGRNIALEGGGSEDGNALAAATFGIPRIPYDEAPPWLGSPTRVMWFDVGMLLVMALACDLLACWALHASRGRFGPSMKRKQAKASLTDKAWHDHLGGLLLPGDSQEQGGCPLPVPQVTLTVENMVYEVDCATSSPAVTPPPARQEQRTTHEYGQAGKGAAQAWMVRQVSQSGRHLTLSPDLEESPARLPVPPPVEDGRLRIVGGVSAVFRPGTLTALMGESGCGKSTLLDCLAGYKTEGYLTGEVRLNGDLRTDALWGCVAGYCEQSDIHKPEFTVRESLTFAARMRLPADVDEAVKISHVDSTLRLLELDDYAEIIVGDEALREGLPKHARKRLTMGVELAANPSILFLGTHTQLPAHTQCIDLLSFRCCSSSDEPTSGLDALSASIVVSALSRISSLKGITIVCTVRPPVTYLPCPHASTSRA